MIKKQPQWKIDRNFNFKEENIDDVKRTLHIIFDVQNGDLSKENALDKLRSLGLITSRESAWEQSKATVYRSYGLLYEAYKITDIAEKFINDEITFKELMLQQIIKKEYKYDDDSSIIHPLVVILSVLHKIFIENPGECWIDAYDYLEYLTEVKEYSEIDECVEKIKNNRNKDRSINYDNANDYDIWCSAFVSTGLLKYVDESSKKLTLNIDELDLILLIINEKNRLSNFEEFNASGDRTSVLNIFGSISGGVYDIINTIGTNNCYPINSILEFYQYRKYVELFLIDGYSHKKIEQTIFNNTDENKIRGMFANYILASLGLRTEDKGALKPFKNYLNLIRINKSIFINNDVYDCIFEGGYSMKINYDSKEKGGINKIYYGAPGCGKSFKVQKELDDVGVAKENRIRTVFHPEYANCDFAGQIMPKVDTDKSVTYEFNPGPFTLAIKQALKTNKMVYLIIEEINRGNAAAIFGDLFQLLDRKREDDQMGRSEYDIENPNIEKYLIDSLRKEEGIDLGNDYHLFIPSNLTILATMNSSDQNVFTLDTAFKRRWYFEQIDNDIINDTNHTYKDWYVPGTETTWKDFMIAVNKKILRNKIQNQTNEDKRMGKYFVTKDCLVENIGDQNEDAARNFAYKVLEYLWNDVCKIGKEDWFDIELYETLEDLVTGFIGNETGDPLSIFKDYINLFGLDENQ